MGIAICGIEFSPSAGCQDFMKLLLRPGWPSDTSFGCSNGSDYYWKPYALSWIESGSARVYRIAVKLLRMHQSSRCLGIWGLSSFF